MSDKEDRSPTKISPDFTGETKVIKPNGNDIIYDQAVGYSVIDQQVQLMNVPDKLDEIMHDQSKFTDEIYDKYEGQEFSCFNFIEQYFKIWYSLMRAGSEIHEAAELIPSKLWKEVPKDFVLDKEKVLEEIIDAQKFINQAIQILGFNSIDVYKMHMKKSEINRKRQKDGYKYQ